MERNEVESATLHVPVNEVQSGMRGRLDALKSRGLSKVHDVQHKLARKQTQVQSSMSNNPMKWAGIAAGSGFALGMLGRLMHHRNKHRPVMDIVVIDAMC